jgi:cytochrome c oxidase subunit III
MSKSADHATGAYTPPHHFPTARSEAEASKLGMWLFLATEILLFSGLFCAYASYKTLNPDIFKAAHKLLDVKWGAINTMVLIFSSLTMALAVRASQLGQKANTVKLLAVTVLCGGAFLVVKYIEYSHKFHVGLLPGQYYNLQGFLHEFHEKFPQVPMAEVQHLGQKAHLFYGIYFLMTGLHGLHVIIGMAAILWALVRANRGDFSSKYYFPVEMVGLYWHLVDLIWIYLFPLLYLVG